MTPKFPNLGLKAMLYIISYSQDENSTISDKAAELSNLIEAVIVNNEVPAKYRTKAMETVEIVDPSIYLDKIHRDRYKNEQLKVLEILKNVSLKLKTLEPEDRNPILRSKLRELNRWIINSLRSWEIEHESIYEVKIHGIMIPLHEGDDQDPALIVNFHNEMAKAFNTKARCPIMVVFETINMSEAKQRKNELEEIANRAYEKFRDNYSNSNKKQKNLVELNQHQGDDEEHDENEEDFIVIGEEDKYDEKDASMEEKSFDEKDSGNFDPNDTHLKSFEQFAKFVKMEERIFTETSDSLSYDE